MVAGISLYSKPVREPGRGLIYQDFERMKGHYKLSVSLREIFERNLKGGGGLLYLGTLEDV